MPELTSAQRRALRARAHSLDPVVLVGDQGLSPNVVAETERALKAHELIKVRVMGAERDDREAMLVHLCELTGAQPVQHIGKVLVIYRKSADKEAAVPAPRRASAKAPTKKAAGNPRSAGRAAAGRRPGGTSGSRAGGRNTATARPGGNQPAAASGRTGAPGRGLSRSSPANPSRSRPSAQSRGGARAAPAKRPRSRR